MKLVENIKAVATGNRRHIDGPLHKIAYGASPVDIYSFNFAREYSIVVTIGANRWISEDALRASDGKVIEYAVDEMKHVILEHVYGEIYRDLRDLQFELRNESNYRESPSLKKLQEIMEKITL
jgi:uncharacterized protein (DUF111 family)